jgi:hypothetical protein
MVPYGTIYMVPLVLEYQCGIVNMSIPALVTTYRWCCCARSCFLVCCLFVLLEYLHMLADIVAAIPAIDLAVEANSDVSAIAGVLPCIRIYTWLSASLCTCVLVFDQKVVTQYNSTILVRYCTVRTRTYTRARTYVLEYRYHASARPWVVDRTHLRRVP